MNRTLFFCLSLLLALFTVQAALGADSVQDSYTTYDTILWDSTANSQYMGTTWTATNNYTLHTITIKLHEKNAGEGVNVWLYNVSDGKCDSYLQYYGNWTTLGTGAFPSYANRNFTNATGYEIVDGEQYCIVMHPDDLTQDLGWAIDTSTSYAGGYFAYNATPPPVGDSGYDAYFLIWGEETAPPGPTNDITRYQVTITDLYDDGALAGVNVTFGDPTCYNTTDGSGIARQTNETCAGLTGTVDYNATLSPYYTITGTIGENSTDAAGMYQAKVNVTAYRAVDEAAITTRFNFSTDGGKNYENGTGVYLNDGANTVYLNASGNTTNGLYYWPSVHSITVAAPYVGVANVTGAYNLRVVVRFLDSTKVQLNENITLNLSQADTNYSLNLFLDNDTYGGNVSLNLTGNYSYFLLGDPDTYAARNTTLTRTILNNTLSYVFNWTFYRERSFNITFRDEVTRELLSNTTVFIDLISVFNATSYNTTTGYLGLELLVPADYTIRYYAADYPERDYYETIASESFFTFNLYLLNTTEATDTLVTVQDTTGDDVENATVQLLRYYPYCNCYEVVEMAKTSYNGLSYFVSQEVQGHYKFIVEYERVTEFISTQPENFIADTTSGQIEKFIQINLDENYYESYVGLTNLYTLLTHNTVTNTVSYAWNDPNSIVTSGCLSIRNTTQARQRTTSVCSAGTSGSVLYTLPSNTTLYYVAGYVTTNTTYSDHTTDTLIVQALYNAQEYSKIAGVGASIILIGGAALFSFSAVAVLLWVLFMLVLFVGVQFWTGLLILPISIQVLTGVAALVLGIAVYMVRR